MSALTGTGQLIWLALRRDRWLLPLWIGVFTAIAGISAAATAGLYPTTQSLASAANGINNTPTLVALYGRVYAPDSLGAVSMIKMTGFGTVLVAVFAIMLTVRHTRGEEESGRWELLGSAVLGRRAHLTAALAVTVGACTALGLLTALALGAAGLPTVGTLAFGATWAAAGAVFGAVGALAAQLSRSARAAVGLALAAVGAAYLLRAVGDSSGPLWLTWLSPIGWGQQVRPFAGERWWVLVAFALAFPALVAAAYRLADARDLGAGMLPERTGPARAALSLRSPLALAWRLQRGALAAWVVGFAILAAVLGNVASTIADLLDSAQAQQWISQLGGQQEVTQAFLAAELTLLAMVASAFGVHVVGRLREQETHAQAELLLASGVSRAGWVGSHVVVALVGTTMLSVTAGLAAGGAHAAQSGDSSALAEVLLGALARLPAQWVVVAVAVCAFGLSRRLVGAGWVALVGAVFLSEFAPLLNLPQWLRDLSPFSHQLGPHLATAPILVFTVVAAALTAVGFTAVHVRDVG